MKTYVIFAVIGVLFLGFVYALGGSQVSRSSSDAPKSTGVKDLPEGSYRVAIFAGGCFWSLESYFEKIPDGIFDVQSGYSSGKIANPSYENYKENGHKEVVQVRYDPERISYAELTEYFFRHIDPTDAGGSFYDRGLNYSSVVYYGSTKEKQIANEIIITIDNAKIFEKKIVTEVMPVQKFWPAEEYHQDYATHNEVRYTSYRIGSGRDAFLKKYWEGKEISFYNK